MCHEFADMSLHEYASVVVGSDASVRLLRSLVTYRGKIFTMRELARTAKVSHPEASRILKRLEKKAVVKLQPVGRARLASRNAESYVLTRMIEPIFRAEKETLPDIVATVASIFRASRAVSIAIYGSVARGAETERSDVDLLVVTDDREQAIERASRANSAISSRFGVALSPLIISEQAFAERGHAELVNSILDSYILVCGEDLRELAEHVKAGH